ncbi:MAG: putative Phosphoglycolate phosphatase [Bacteroidetes bacterium]|nr:putative Phosphoglycolate phosphatase [Bacteroidota bacterium]
MNKNRAQAYLRLINYKQRHGKVISTYTDGEKYHCNNCHIEFEGNYCSNCGQSRSTSRFTYKSVIKNVFHSLAHVDGSFFFTVKELFTRPGYMIGDYIAGRRVIYYRPIQMLFILGALYMLLVHNLHPATAVASSEMITPDNANLKLNDYNLVHWLNSSFIRSVTKTLEHWFTGNKALEIMCTLPIYALATHWAFRKRAYNQHYNLVEFFFVRTYAACQMLIASIILLPFMSSGEEGIPWWLEVLFSVWIYAQLFREKIGYTIKRTIVMYIYFGLIFILLAIIVVAILTLLAFIVRLFA